MGKKARGLYDYLSEEAKELYEKILNISFSDNFKNFTKKEISYLTHLYEEKVKEIKEECKDRPLNEKDAYTIGVCVKMKNLSAFRNVNLTRVKFSTDQLTTKQKTDARVKLNNTLKPLLR